MNSTAYTRKKNMAAKLAAELAETRALQPRLKAEMYQRQAAAQHVDTPKRQPSS